MLTNHTRWLAGLLAVAVVAFSTGVGRCDDEPKDLDKIPKVVMDALKAKFPKAKIAKWSKETENNKVVYDGRLKSDNPAARQQLILQRPRRPLTPAGLHFAGVPHAGNSQSSAEEGNAILDVYRSLIDQSYQDRDGNQRTIGAADILVVTPTMRRSIS